MTFPIGQKGAPQLSWNVSSELILVQISLIESGCICSKNLQICMHLSPQTRKYALKPINMPFNLLID